MFASRSNLIQINEIRNRTVMLNVKWKAHKCADLIKIAVHSDETPLFLYSFKSHRSLAHSCRIFLFPFPSSFLSPFLSPFRVSSSLRHRYVLCDPIATSCPTSCAGARHSATRAHDCGADRSTLWSVANETPTLN